MLCGRTNVNKFLIEEQRRNPALVGDFSMLISDVVRSCKAIAQGVSRGSLAGVLGDEGSENVQGEAQKKLDVLANQAFIHHCEWGGHLAAMASEEMDDIYPIPVRESARQVSAGFRPARRFVEHRRQPVGRQHLFGPALPREL
jgi:fructose-1,6-bisphosphatase